MVTVLPPIEILPVAFFLEVAAGIVLVRGGFRHADRKLALGLILLSATGVPIGLTLLRIMDPVTSSAVALAIILAMASLLLLNVRLRGLDTFAGLCGSGLLSGIVTGVASIGGLVVVVYTFSLDRPAAVVRGTLIAFLFASIPITAISFAYFGIFTAQAFARATMLAAPMLAGVAIGMRLFSPTHEILYRRICLGLLIGIATIGLARMAV